MEGILLNLSFLRHIMVALHWVRSVIRKWWPELSNTEKRLRDSTSEDRWVVHVQRKFNTLLVKHDEWNNIGGVKTLICKLR